MTNKQLTLDFGEEQERGPGPHGHKNPLNGTMYMKGCRCDECKAAHKEYCRRYYQEHIAPDKPRKQAAYQRYINKPGKRERHRERSRERSKLPSEKLRKLIGVRRKRAENTILLAEIRIERGCIDCGYREHFAAMDFDHIDEKNEGVTRMTCRSTEAITAEIELCEIRCRNCHRRKTRIQMAIRRKSIELSTEPYVVKVREKSKIRRQWLADYKIERGCVDCGFKGWPEALDFDHVRGEKKFDLSAAMSRTMKSVLEEIEKTQIRCANCHSIRTYEHEQAKKAGETSR